MHLQADHPPHVLEHEMGLKLADPGPDWRKRPDMEPVATSGFRASIIIACSRFIVDLVADQLQQGVSQYAIIGAVLDIFAQRRPEIASRFVPADFEGDDSWWTELVAAGYIPNRPVVLLLQVSANI